MPVAMIAASSAPAAKTDTGLRPLITGVANPPTDMPLAFPRIRAAGARFVRVPLHLAAALPGLPPQSWRPTDPADPNYSWSRSDAAVENAIAAGLTPVLQIGGVPAWAQRCTAPTFEWTLCDPDPAALAAFASAAAQRYSGATPGVPRVRYWQALNEPNHSFFFYPQFGPDGGAVSPGLYREVVNHIYTAVKSVDRSNLLLLGGPAPNASSTWVIGPMPFTRELLCMRKTNKPAPGGCGGGVRFDIFAIQPYTTGAPTREGHPDNVQLGDLGKLQALLRAAERAGRIKNAFKRTPLWITEFSWDSNPPDPGALPMRILTRWTAEALHVAWRAGVSHFFWYSLRDSAPDPGVPFSQSLESGLYFRGATPEQDQAKPSLRAFRFPFVAHRAKRGLGFWGRTPNSRRGRVAIQLRRGGRWQRIVVTRANKAGIFRGTAPARLRHARGGLARAVYRRNASAPFPLRPSPDFRQKPFG